MKGRWAVSERVARIRVELQELEPKIWWRIDVPVRSSLALLHETIRLAMGWKFFESYEFHILGRSYGNPAFDDDRSAGRVYKAGSQRLETVIARGAERFLYLFDSTDQWRHDVIVEQVREGDAGAEYPAIVDGARRCPPRRSAARSGSWNSWRRCSIPSTRNTRGCCRERCGAVRTTEKRTWARHSVGQEVGAAPARGDARARTCLPGLAAGVSFDRPRGRATLAGIGRDDPLWRL